MFSLLTSYVLFGLWATLFAVCLYDIGRGRWRRLHR